jgi:crotonobetainyl-CoA:carnitine CoA-transferase CaiB-like acyl-CoA transferase
MKGEEKGLLRNILVLDLADEQGSFCSKLLADLGATVIKVEGPENDPPRSSLSFFYHNTNKLGVVLDLETRAGRHAFRKLIEKADVLVETSPRGLKAPGLGSRYWRRVNPRLICVSITGFGRTGPRRAYLSCDGIASAFGGQMYVSGVPSGPPVKLFGPQSCYAASLFAANAALLGLRRRRVTGKGCHVDLSIQEAVASTLDHVMIDYFHNGEIAGRPSPRSEAFSIVPCKDGYIQIPIFRNWETLLELMRSEGKAGDLCQTKWRQESYLQRHRGRFVRMLEEWTRGHTKLELFELGQAMQFPWAPVASLPDVLRSPQLKARRFFVRAARSRGDSPIWIPGPPYRFSGYSPPRPKPAPFRGPHTRQVLKSLGAGGGKRSAYRGPTAPSHSAQSRNILRGIRVVDLSRMLSGPYATRILGDFGAEVIKVQSRMTALGAEQNNTPYFGAWNRNKRSISLNLSFPEARDIFLELVAISDVVVENFSPRVLANWGLTYERLRKVKPDLVMASISAMGRTGPWKNFVGFGPTFHALSGLASATARPFDRPAGLGHAYGDIVAGLYAALAILSSMEHRDATGKGQYIDLSAYEALCSLLGPALMEVSSAPRQLARIQPREDCAAAPCGCYPCLGEDRWCAIAVSSEAQWRAFRRVLCMPELAADRFSTPAGRRKNRAELDGLTARWTAAHTAETVVLRLQQRGVRAGVVQNAEDLARDSQLAARRFFVSLKHPALGSTFSDRSALWPWRERPAGWKAAPLLGEDNHHVFVELLGHSEAEFQSFVERGIIR